MSDSVRRDGSRRGERLIRGGRVRWMGRWYRLVDGALPMEEYRKLSLTRRADQSACPRYDGRLDGKVGHFYTYGNHHEGSKTHVYLHSIVGEGWPGTQCVEGVFHWDLFRVEQASAAKGGAK